MNQNPSNPTPPPQPPTSGETPLPPPPLHVRLNYGEQNADGVDLSLIRENLRLSVDERLAKADRARDSVLALRRYTRVHVHQQPRPDRRRADQAPG